MRPDDYARIFAPALASQAQEEGKTRITDGLYRRAIAAWSMPLPAYPLLRQEADKLLADGRTIVIDGPSWEIFSE